MKQKTMMRGWMILLIIVCGYSQPSEAQITKSVAGSLPTDAVGMGKYICNNIDLNRPDMAKVKSYAAAGHYDLALNAWRDARVMSFRQTTLGIFAYHDSYTYGTRAGSAEALTGITGPTVNTNFNDVYGISGAPGTANINWLVKDANGNYYDTYSDFTFTIPLVYRFWQKNNNIYINKWFEITNNFATYQRDAVAALPLAEQQKAPANYMQTAGNTLTQGDRVASILIALADLSKSLTGPGKVASWDSIGNTVTTPVPDSSLQKFPAISLARIAVSLVLDHSTALLNQYVTAGAVPNQRRNGLAALLQITQEFPEFNAITNIKNQTISGLNDYLTTQFQMDGPMLEQSFNYNLGDALSLGDMSTLVKTTIPDLSNTLKSKQIGFYQMLAAVNSPLCQKPGLGSQNSGNPPAIWLSAQTKSTFYTNQLMTSNSPGQDDPLVADIYKAICGTQSSTALAFTSVTFPYSGYSAQRRDWNWDSPYLFFVNSRATRGHRSNNNNSIQICAFGRPLLGYGGPAIYGGTTLTGDIPPADFDKANIYFGENSSLKSNTIVVDGQSQIAVDNTTASQQAGTAPLPRSWYTSTEFDYLEGNYTGGYITAGDVGHRRKVIFVRKPGFWIITDEVDVNDKKSHSLSQIWRFPTNSYTNAFGFGQGDVKIDTAAKCIYTNQPSSPNISLYQFGSMPLTYNEFYGDKTPYLGWSALSFSNFVPSPDAHVSWTSADKSVIITVIWAQPDASRPAIKTRNLSIAGNIKHAGAEIKLPNGRTITCLSSAESETQTIGTISYKAKILFTIDDGKGNIEGFATDESSAATPYQNFAFNYLNGVRKTATQIQQPSKFVWTNTNGKYYPVYNDSMPITNYSVTTTTSNNDTLATTKPAALLTTAPQGIKVYPNPAQNKVVMLHFSGMPKGSYHVVLTSTYGRVAASQTVSYDGQTPQIMLPAVNASGVYFLQITGPSYTLTEKVVVQ